jgi:hypothetical protein
LRSRNHGSPLRQFCQGGSTRATRQSLTLRTCSAPG